MRTILIFLLSPMIYAQTLVDTIEVKCNAGDRSITTFNHLGQTFGPSFFGFTKEGNLWIADVYNNRIVEFDARGNWKKAYSPADFGPWIRWMVLLPGGWYWGDGQHLVWWDGGNGPPKEKQLMGFLPQFAGAFGDRLFLAVDRKKALTAQGNFQKEGTVYLGMGQETEAAVKSGTRFYKIFRPEGTFLGVEPDGTSFYQKTEGAEFHISLLDSDGLLKKVYTLPKPDGIIGTAENLVYRTGRRVSLLIVETQRAFVRTFLLN